MIELILTVLAFSLIFVLMFWGGVHIVETFKGMDLRQIGKQIAINLGVALVVVTLLLLITL